MSAMPARYLVRAGAAAAALLLLLLVLTLWLWAGASREARDDARRRFDFDVSQARFALEQRLLAYQQVVHAGAALFAATPGITSDHWRKYVAELNLGESYPAVQAMAFAQRVHGADREGAPIVFVEPRNARNQRLVGLDLMRDPVRREAIVRASETALPALSGKIDLVQDSEGETLPAFMLCTPAISAGIPAAAGGPASVPLDGFICLFLPVAELMRNLQGPEDRPDPVRLKIFDSDRAEGAPAMYDSEREGEGAQYARPTFVAEETLEFLGRRLSLVFGSPAHLDGDIDAQKPRLVLFGGLLASALLTALFWSFAMNRWRARELARANAGLKSEVEERTRLGSQLRQITDAMPALIARLDADSRFRFQNAAYEAFFDIKPADMEGRTLREVLGDEVHQELQPRIAEVLAGYPVRYERTQATPGRPPMDLAGQLFPRYGEDGEGLNIVGFYLLESDVTPIKRVSRMKSEFISMVSHELRTPLTSIRGSLGLLAGGVAGALPASAQGLVDIAKNNCERLIRLINDILDTEKLESGKMRFDSKVLELRPLVEQSLQANEGYATQHGIRLVLHAQPEPLRAFADGDRLAQVLTNLVSNAVKFSPKDATVDVHLQRSGASIRIEVRDHGPGIPDEFRGRIFQKFSQADSSDTRVKGGTGLGLSISKSIVERMGGTIGFASEIGRGTTFFFEMPEWRDAGLPGGAGGPTSPARSRVLVCEDDRDIARLIVMMVEHAGFDADVAYSAMAARERLATGKYAAMTVDINLPDEDGISLIRALREDPGTRDLPVVVVSASAAEGHVRLNTETLSVADWLQKPIDENRLVSTLRSVVDGYAERPRVLHVEDDPDVRQVAAAIAHDFAVFEFAGSLHEARERLLERHFDLVLLDLDLPDGSGWNLLPDVARHVPRPPIVVFSASDANEVAAGKAQATLVKAHTSNAELLATLQRVIAPRSAPANPR